MLLRRVLPADGNTIDVDEPGADETLADWYRPAEADSLRLMMIATLDGQTVGGDGVSDSLSSRVDRRILAAVRRHADAIFVGAETVRRESIGRPRSAALIVVSASGDLDGHRLREADDGAPLLVVTTAAGTERASASLARIPHETLALATDDDGRIPAGSIVALARRRGYAHLVCEGGPGLAAQFLDAGLFTELCLTTAPAVGGATPLFGASTRPARPLWAAQLLVDEAGFSYGRWRPEEPSASHR